MREPQDIQYEVDFFADRKRVKLRSIELLQESPPPRSPGVYGWYFDEPPPYVPIRGCTFIKTGWWPFRTKWWLVYIGQAENLKERIVHYHINGGHYAKGTMSSFRLSLGCLLSRELGLILHHPPQSFGEKDKEFNKWLEKHARVSWVRPNNISIVENKAITEYVLPLNYRDNEHPLRVPLSNLRSEFRSIAEDPDRKPRKKDFRKAYKRFARECKRLGIKK